MLELTADEDCRCAETTDPENYRQHIGEFVDSGYDVIVPVGLALGATPLLRQPPNIPIPQTRKSGNR